MSIKKQPDEIFYVFCGCGCRVKKEYLRPAPIEVRRRILNSHGKTMAPTVHLCHKHATPLEYRVGVCIECGKEFQFKHSGVMPCYCPDHQGQRKPKGYSGNSGVEDPGRNPFREISCTKYFACMDKAVESGLGLDCGGCSKLELGFWLDIEKEHVLRV